MWIEKRGDKYLAVMEYSDYMTGKKKRVSVIMEKNTQQSRNKADSILRAKIEAKQEEKPTEITLKELETAYLTYQRKLYKESTTKRNEIVLNVVVGIIGSDTLCARLSAGNIIKALLDTGKPNVTLNSYLTRLKAMLRWGYQHDMCPEIASKLTMFPDKTERLPQSAACWSKAPSTIRLPHTDRLHSSILPPAQRKPHWSATHFQAPYRKHASCRSDILPPLHL